VYPVTTTAKQSTDPKVRLVRGCAAIGAAIGLGERAAYHLIAKKQLPARKLGGQWFAVEEQLLAYVSRSTAAPLDELAEAPKRDTAAQTAPARRRRWDKRRLPQPDLEGDAA
jgi:hypothetical protein